MEWYGQLGGDSCFPRAVVTLSPSFSMFATPSLSEVVFLSEFLDHLKTLKHFPVDESIMSQELSVCQGCEHWCILLDLQDKNDIGYSLHPISLALGRTVPSLCHCCVTVVSSQHFRTIPYLFWHSHFWNVNKQKVWCSSNWSQSMLRRDH